jgi:SAM-dependent methyltransferase
MVGRDEWDRRYEGADRLFSANPDAELVARAGSLPPGRAVDLGAGEGRNAIWLALAGWQVTAVDFSQVALGRLRARAESENLTVETVRSDIGDYLQKGETFDLVVVANIHPDPDDRRRLLQAAAAAVAPGGHLFVVGHHLDSFGRAGPPDETRFYTEERLAGLYPGLELLELSRIERSHGDIDTPVVDLVLWATRPSV